MCVGFGAGVPDIMTNKEKLDKLWKLIDEYGTKDDPLEHRPELKKSRNSDNFPWVLAEIRRILED